MIALACACALLALPQTGGGGLDRAMELLRAGDIGAAWAAAESEPDTARRAQAIVYVRWQAGDLEGALAAAESGSAAHPRDVWLAARVIDLAVVLRRTATAERSAQRLESAAATMSAGTIPENERAAARAALDLARAPLDELRRAGDARDGASRRARAVVTGLAVLSVLLIGWLAFAPRRAR